MAVSLLESQRGSVARVPGNRRCGDIAVRHAVVAATVKKTHPRERCLFFEPASRSSLFVAHDLFRKSVCSFRYHAPAVDHRKAGATGPMPWEEAMRLRLRTDHLFALVIIVLLGAAASSA